MRHLPQGVMPRGHQVLFFVTLSFLFKFPNYIIYEYAYSYIPFFKILNNIGNANIVLTLSLTASPVVTTGINILPGLPLCVL